MGEWNYDIKRLIEARRIGCRKKNDKAPHNRYFSNLHKVRYGLA